MSVLNEDSLVIEQFVADFERSWSTDHPLDIAAFVPNELTESLRQRLLWELVEADLELSIKSGTAARVEDYLARFPSLRRDAARLADFVGSEYRLRARREPALDSREYERRFPEIAEQVLAQGTRLEKCLPASSATDEQPARGTADPTEPTPPDSIGYRTHVSGRFRLIRPHDEGGLGKVWLAYDDELKREVALKEIRSRFADDEVSRYRFATEVLVTSGLEHPGIVPVYGFSHYKDGRPYYTMRFVKGVSFREAIRSFYQQDWSLKPAGSQRVEMQRLLGHFLDVCNTINYAHQRGVLHRDIKPGNIMLGDYGETLVVDWGLAKLLGQPGQRAEEFMPTPRDADADACSTKVGRALGSPAYMSPEQARGEHDRLGPAADIYSLGATLYTLLTNHAPAESENTEELLATVTAGRLPRPRSLNSSIPVTLESICLKAMSPLPENRYATARHLAEDVERYLADQPVSSHRETLFEQLSRFTRNHQALVRGAILALITLAATFFVAALLIDEQRRLAEQFAQSESEHRRAALNARLHGDAQHARAERYLELLKSAFQVPGDGVGHDVTLYEGLNRAVANLNGASAEHARTMMEVARLYADIRAYPEASRCAETAIEWMSAELGNDDPEVAEARAWRAELLHQIAVPEQATIPDVPLAAPDDTNLSPAEQAKKGT